MYKETNELVQCEFLKGFYKVPDKEASVNRRGQLFLYENQKLYYAPDFTSIAASNKGYAYAGKYSIHICVTETFIKLPEGAERKDVIVNHKDGIKVNNDVENLEWTSYSGNIIHAYDTGLRTDNTRLKARNISTGEVIEFRSIGQCARFFKVNNNRVFGYLNRKIRESAFLDTHLLVRETEKFPTDEESRNWKVSDNRASVILYNPNEKSAVIYQTMADASKAMGLSKTTIGVALLRAKNKNSYTAKVKGMIAIPIQYGLDYMQYVKEDRRSDTWVRDFEPPKRTKPKVKVTNLLTGGSQEFLNIYEMAKFFGVRHETVMKARSKTGCYGDFKIELL